MSNNEDIFSYEVWTAETEVTLCNVRFDASYKDTVYYESTNALNAAIDAKGDITRIRNASYARVDEPIRISMPFGRAQQYNYVRVYNPAQPVNGDQPKYYYYFILGFSHVAPNVTEMVVQLDLWQTYIRDVKLGLSYVIDGHIGIANQHAGRNYGRDYLTIRDGLETGAEYVNVASKRVPIMDPFQNSNEPTFNVLAISTVDLNANHGTKDAPEAPSGKPTYIQSGIPSGAAMYVWDNALDFMAFMDDYSDKPWVTKGIVSITLVPPQQRWFKYGSDFGGRKDPKTGARRGYVAAKVRYNLWKNWRGSADILNYIPERYRHLRKFLTSPYCLLEMSFNAGSSVVLKPENWNSRDANVVEMVSIMPPDQRLAIAPVGYNGRNKSEDTEGVISFGNIVDYGDGKFRDGDFLSMAIFMSGFPTIPIVNDGQISYLASNARSIAAQYSSTDWAHQKNMRANATAYDQASMGINAGRALADNAMSADAQQTAIQMNLASQQALFGMFGGAAAGAGMGAFAGPVGAVAGGIGGLVSGGMNMISTGMSNDAASQALAARTSAAGTARDINSSTGKSLRDSNRALSDWAAKGDYADARSALDAKIQDTAVIPHGMSGQFGGEAFNLANDEAVLSFKVKMIDQAAMSVVGEHWLRYGYPVHRPMVPPKSLSVMTKFSYWKMAEVYIEQADMPEAHKQGLRGILEKGVTVWADESYIGTTDPADNRPLPGFTIEGYVPPEWEPDPRPEPPAKPKKRKKKMLVYSTIDGTQKWALAGSSPGTVANWRETDSTTLANQYLAACGMEEPVMLDITDFYATQNDYLQPLSTLEYVEGP